MAVDLILQQHDRHNWQTGHRGNGFTGCGVFVVVGQLVEGGQVASGLVAGGEGCCQRERRIADQEE